MKRKMEYLEYFNFYLNGLSKAKKKSIKTMLTDAQLAPVEFASNGLPKDNSELDVTTFILKCMLNNQKAIELYQRYECYQNYKYSNYFKIISSESIDPTKFNAELIQQTEEVEILNKKNEIEKTMLYSLGGKLCFKFSFGLEKFNEQFMGTTYTKLTFILLVDPVEKTAEIRYDGTTSPFKTTQESYLHFVDLIVKFIKEKFKIELEYMDFLFLTDKEILDKVSNLNYHILETAATFEDSGSAVLSSNLEKQRPFVDEIKNLFDLKEKEFIKDTMEYKVFDEVKREILDFIQTKENEARYKKIVLELEEFRTRFNYVHALSKIICSVHHEFITNNQEGRLENVRDIIFRIEKQFNGSANSRS